MIPSEITVRETTPADLAAIVEVQKAAFGSDNEAGLTAKLLADPSAGPVVSLLALRGAEPVGHILFTRCRVENGGAEQPMLHILAPPAVVPACQKQGIGGRLIAEGLELLRRRGTRLVFVLGHKPITGATDSSREQRNWDFQHPIRLRRSSPTTGWCSPSRKRVSPHRKGGSGAPTRWTAPNTGGNKTYLR